jgi:hypothetical protein
MVCSDHCALTTRVEDVAHSPEVGTEQKVNILRIPLCRKGFQGEEIPIHDVAIALVVVVDEAVAPAVFEFVVLRPFERPGVSALGVELLDFAFGLGRGTADRAVWRMRACGVEAPVEGGRSQVATVLRGNRSAAGAVVYVGVQAVTWVADRSPGRQGTRQDGLSSIWRMSAMMAARVSGWSSGVGHPAELVTVGARVAAQQIQGALDGNIEAFAEKPSCLLDEDWMSHHQLKCAPVRRDSRSLIRDLP